MEFIPYVRQMVFAYISAMGSPLSPIVANIFMDDFETKALETAPQPPKSVEKIRGWHLSCHRSIIQRRVFPTH